MAIEYEKKYVLSLEAANDLFGNSNLYSKRIEQGYLGQGRIRYCSDFSNWFTFKYTLPEGQVVELEHKISDKDFDVLWPHATNKVAKIRYNFTELNVAENWDIDIFTNKGEIYFVMAECEMYIGQQNPYIFPEVITENLIHEVDYGDNRFSSKSLSSVEYAKNLLKQIKDKTI